MKGAAELTSCRAETFFWTSGLSVFIPLRRRMLIAAAVLNAFPLSCGLEAQTPGAAAGNYTVQAGTVQAGTVRAGTVQAGTVRAGTVRAGTVQAGTVQAGTVQAGTVRENENDFGAGSHGSLTALTAVPLSDVRFPELTPEEAERFGAIEESLRSEDWESAFSEMSGFLLLAADRYVPGTERKVLETASAASGNRIWRGNASTVEGELVPVCPRTVADVCGEWILGLPEAGRSAWRAWADAKVSEELAALGFFAKTQSKGVSGLSAHSFGTSPAVFLERIRRRNPYSSFESEILEILACLAWNEGRTLEAARFWEAELAERERFSPENVPGRQRLTELPALEVLRARSEEIRKFAASCENSEKPEFLQKFRISMIQVQDHEGRILFEDLLPEEQRGTLFSDRKRDLEAEMAEVPSFGAFSPETNILAVRMGTRVTFWPEGVSETRPQTYLAFLDLSREGALLGIAVPETPWRTYVGEPLADGKFAYIPSLFLGERGEFALDILSLTDGSLVGRIPLFSADLREVEKESLFLPLSWVSERRIRIGVPECRVVREVELSELP